jgi:hypothetical protein
VSDTGILAVTNNCSNLENLNVNRTNLLFKITDVSLLALGERCPSLQVSLRGDSHDGRDDDVTACNACS